ncbi:polysaccharide deacetylase [Massilia glaciei]|uniref:Polysaccharide deacetylase n=2 Tax=Massilia glaciei TaxID=1524097 RepID=A0A2U2HEI4_9BURK|nr:polysaccharide deacetylase [Massilia glaciei]
MKQCWIQSQRSLVFFVCALLTLNGPAMAQSSFQWPANIKAAVSLAYDDALDSQLDVAIPALNKHRLKASFYLQLSNPSVGARMAEWRAAALGGHELGNHTLFHQCSGAQPDRAWVQAHRDLESTSVAQMKDQILLANAMLYAIDGKRARTFTAPCGDRRARGVNYLDSIKDDFVAIKAGAGSAVTPSMAALDLHAVNVHAPVGMSGKQLIDLVKAAAAQGTMLNLTFHGVGGDYLTTSRQAHEELLAYLSTNRDTIWTDTFLNIATFVQTQRAPK